MISGEYEIKKNDIDHITYTERTIVVECCVVVDDYSENNSAHFFEELEALLNKYAI
jgi:hypothetical protein